jgi:hypothetical protein
MTDLDHGADLRGHIDRALADLSAPDGLTTAALSDGRRLRRRRRVLTAGGGVVAAAAVTTLVVATLGGGAPSSEPRFATQPSASPTPHSDTPSPGPDPSSLPSGWLDGGEGNGPWPDLPEGWWDAPSDRLVEHLQGALPAGVAVTEHELAPSDRAPGEADVSPGWLHATLSSSTGPGDFEIIMYLPDLEETPDPVTTTDAAGNEGTTMFAQGRSNLSRVKCGHQSRYTDSCDEILDADGEHIGRLTSFLQDGTITFYEATLLGPDGGLLYLSTWNATDGKPGPDTTPSADVPPLTLGQLRALLQDPFWTSYRP